MKYNLPQIPPSNIKGIGVDILNINRIERLLGLHYEKFINKILSINEQEALAKIRHSEKQVAYIAKRFSAKEAISKAVGSGIGTLSFKDIEILNESSGKPYVKINGVNKEQSDKILISLSDDYPNVIAFAVIFD